MAEDVLVFSTQANTCPKQGTGFEADRRDLFPLCWVSVMVLLVVALLKEDERSR